MREDGHEALLFSSMPARTQLDAAAAAGNACSPQVGNWSAY